MGKGRQDRASKTVPTKCSCEMQLIFLNDGKRRLQRGNMRVCERVCGSCESCAGNVTITHRLFSPISAQASRPVGGFLEIICLRCNLFIVRSLTSSSATVIMTHCSATVSLQFSCYCRCHLMFIYQHVLVCISHDRRSDRQTGNISFFFFLIAK